MTNDRFSTSRARLHRRTLALAVGAALLTASGLAFGQATTGQIVGTAPVKSGEIVQVTGKTGLSLKAQIGSTGRFDFTVPIGTYTVTLLRNGQVVQTRTDVTMAAGGAVTVNFTPSTSPSNVQKLAGLTVAANSLPAIDFNTTTLQTTITASQLRHLPIERNAAAIAMLAPGVGLGQSGDGTGPTGAPLLSFGGASIVENAYYINGMNTTDPVGNLGGLSLPYNSIAQQQVLTSGFGAKYGRAIGGVLNQVGKSGTNQWHFGGRVSWQPNALRAKEVNVHWANPRVTTGSEAKGQLERWRKDNDQWNTTYDAYVGGPIIKNTLFVFASAEWDKTKGNTVGTVQGETNDFQTVENPKYYVNIVWNINDSNVIDATGVYNSMRIAGDTYAYSNANHTTDAFQSADESTDDTFKMWVLKYTSYISSDLTLNALYGKMDGRYISVQPAYPGFDPSVPLIEDASLQNPALSPTGLPGLHTAQTHSVAPNPKHRSEDTSLRVDLQYRIGINTIDVGIDNLQSRDANDGVTPTGPGFAWQYFRTADPLAPIAGTPGGAKFVAAPGAASDGYVVSQSRFADPASFVVQQRAQYATDRIHVGSDLLVTAGIRRGAFTNYNPVGIPYIKEKNMWQPRLGANWDVFGNQKLDIFANAGRYYLALPAGMGLRTAGAPLATFAYFNYTGITKDGIPTGLTPIFSVPRPTPEGGQTGKPVRPEFVASANIKAEYQDNFSLGAKERVAHGLVAGLTLHYNVMGRTVQQWDDLTGLRQILKADGLDGKIDFTDLPIANMFNPGHTADIRFLGVDGNIITVPFTPEQMGFNSKPKRKYWAADFSLTHPWDGRWFGQIDYILSHSYGNTEGGPQSDIGQANPASIAATETWNDWEIMEYAGGDMPNDRRHVVKAFGYVQVLPDWMVSANILIEQGTPVSCIGYFGAQETDPLNYVIGNGGGAYHFCGGVPTPPGSTGRTPWLDILNLGLQYSPAWSHHRLAFTFEVHNVFNQQRPLQLTATYGSKLDPRPSYLLPFARDGDGNPNALNAARYGYEAPRYVTLSVTYNY